MANQIIILGAGVTGLQTAISLLTNPSTSHYKISILASHVPGDKAPLYTSPWAGGHWRAHSTTAPEDREQREWDRRTYEFWTGLIWGKEGISPDIDSVGAGELERARARMRAVGLGEKESRNYWAEESSETARDGSGLWWKDVVQNFRILDLENEKLNKAPTVQTDHRDYGNGNGGVPEDAIFGITYQSICINVPQYLNFLFATATKLGAKIIKTDVDATHGLEGVVADAKNIVLSGDTSIKEADITALINCTGLSAAKFLSEAEAAKLYPVRGQTILVKGSASMARTFTEYHNFADGSSELVYVIPRPGSGTTILGGCKQSGDWNAEVDTEMSGRIVERIQKWRLAEELRTGEGGSFEILGQSVGFRPARKGGPRVEVEGSEKVAGVWVVHSYGHAGAGYQNSIGSAEKVVGLVEDL